MISTNSQRPRSNQAENRRTDIPHFDATLRRKENLRRKSEGDAVPVARQHRVQPVLSEIPQPRVQVPAQTVRMVAMSTPDKLAPPSNNTRPDANAMAEMLVGFVVEQTGYPAEMVELDADLEADLGIDSIKKAQLVAELAEKFQILPLATNGTSSLDDFRTLRDILGFLSAVLHGNAKSSEPLPRAVAHATTHRLSPAVPPRSFAVDRGQLERQLIHFVVENTGYPEELVELDADLEADLGIDSIKKAQIVAELAEQFEVSQILARSGSDLDLDNFRSLRQIADFLSGATGQRSDDSVSGRINEPAAASNTRTTSDWPVSHSAGVESAGQDSQEIERLLVSFVIDQTGYPEEMVDLDADLEADLGIDSIKKAQLVAELVEQLQMSSSDLLDANVSLDDFRTLRDVAQTLRELAVMAPTS